MNCVYYFTNYNDEIIYVGRTFDIKRRVKQHFTKGHLPKECYDSVKDIFYSEVNDSKYDTEICETLLINKYKPLYNTEKKFNENENKTSFSLLELNFKPIYFNFETMEPQFKKPNYSCYELFLLQERCDALINYNLLMIQYKPGMMNHYLVDIINKRNDILLIVHKVYNFLSKYVLKECSNLDEPISDTGNIFSTFVAFNFKMLETYNISKLDILLLYRCGFIFEVKDNIFGIPLFTENTLRIMNNRIKGEENACF